MVENIEDFIKIGGVANVIFREKKMFINIIIVTISMMLTNAKKCKKNIHFSLLLK